MSDADRLIVFSRFPGPGRSKTRMIPALGADGAAELHRHMARHTLQWTERLIETRPVDVRVRFTGADETAMAECFGSQFYYEAQGDGDLGQRLERAFRESFQAGCRRVIVVGTDCPSLSEAIVRQALDHLRDHDLVIGPATDGGYYLIGLARHAESLFQDISWGGDQVLQQTLTAALQAKLSIAVLPTLADVDRPEDLAVWEQARTVAAEHSAVPAISVVIPTLDVEPLLESALVSASSSDATERIVVAAGRSQESLRLAVKHRCRFLTSPPGRARQMNAGARAASNATLLFLHADTRLPSGYATEVHSTLSTPGVVAGAFSLTIAAHGWKYRLIEQGVALRSRWRQMPYGDQALFLRRDVFENHNGFSDLPLMEDFDLMRRLRRTGRIAISPVPVQTSARRWKMLGPLRTTVINQCAIVGYYLGVPCERLAIWYRAEMERGRRDSGRVAFDVPTVPSDVESEVIAV